MIVHDHNSGDWGSRYARLKRTNGAFTYSKDICEWHLPVWEPLLDPDESVATCGKVGSATVQYLHERTQRALSPTTKAFVTTYRDLADSLGPRGIWIPNAIDERILPKAEPTLDWVYYGNLIGDKRDPFKALPRKRFQVVSGLRDQSQALGIVSRHRYGIGVGRCALEMVAMGMKVIIFGKSFGGLILSQSDFEKQRDCNFNGSVLTGVGSIEEAFDRIEESLLPPVSFQDLMPEISGRIKEGWSRAWM
jgi:hypothetical protein